MSTSPTSSAFKPEPAAVRYSGLVIALNEFADDLQVFDLDHDFVGEPPIRELRRKGRRAEPDKEVMTLTLVEEDGVLYWRDRMSSQALSGRRVRRVGQMISGEIVTQRRFKALEPDKVNASIQKLDDRFSAPRGLRKLVNGQWQSVAGPFTGRTLLLVHGTFSNNDHFLDEFKATLHGQQFLGRAQQHYSQVLAFDHPTLAIGPLLNAVELTRLLAGSAHNVDVIAHSRGGLVTRWWLEVLGGCGQHSRAVLVGSPIEGTSLAAGPRIRGGLDLLTNYGIALEKTMALVGAANPFLVAPAAVLRVLLSVTGVASKLPIADAAVAMVPGLFAQARIGNNAEIALLQAGPPPLAVDYFAVRSNFEPQDEGWRFWRYFRRTTLANSLADSVFDDENDLVVDTDSMTSFGQSSAKLVATWDFKTNADVHHVNYFRQQETIAFITKSLQIP